ncbi:hypothetical protein HMI55_000219, partial [Coelomomyces lativittatus]
MSFSCSKISFSPPSPLLFTKHLLFVCLLHVFLTYCIPIVHLLPLSFSFSSNSHLSFYRAGFNLSDNVNKFIYNTNLTTSTLLDDLDNSLLFPSSSLTIHFDSSTFELPSGLSKDFVAVLNRNTEFLGSQFYNRSSKSISEKITQSTRYNLCFYSVKSF